MPTICSAPGEISTGEVGNFQPAKTGEYSTGVDTVSQVDGQTKLKATPWVRVVRHEYLDRPNKHERNERCVIDVVHKDFLSDFITRELIPFSKLFAQRVLRHPD